MSSRNSPMRQGWPTPFAPARPTPWCSTSGCRRPIPPRVSRRQWSSSASTRALGVLVLSQHIETRHAVDLLRSGHGGVGYLLKERITRSTELVDALARVASGETVIDPEVVHKVFDRPRQTDPITQLTAKERQVLALVAEGLSNERIAVRLEVTTRTVETHTSRIFFKLGLHEDRTNHRRVLAVLAHLRAIT